MKSSSTGEIKMEGKKQPPIHTANRRGLGSAAPGAISKSQITAPYLRDHISPLSAPEIGSSLSYASRSSLEMLFIRDYRQPLNKRCLCLRSKVFRQILNSSDSSEGIEGRTPYLASLARGGLLRRDGWKCSRWEIWDKTSKLLWRFISHMLSERIHTEMRCRIDSKCRTLHLKYTAAPRSGRYFVKSCQKLQSWTVEFLQLSKL